MKKYKLACSQSDNKWELVQRDYTTDNLVLNEPYPVDDIMVYPKAPSFHFSYAIFYTGWINGPMRQGTNWTYYEYDNFKG